MKRGNDLLMGYSSNEGVPQGTRLEDAIGTISGLSQRSRVIACRGWFLMTGATIHTCSDRHTFLNYQPIEKRVIMVDGHSTHAVGVGNVTLRMSTCDSLILEDVLHVPSIMKGIISASKLNNEGYSVLLASKDTWRMFRQKNSQLFRANGTIVCGMYRLTGKMILQELLIYLMMKVLLIATLYDIGLWIMYPFEIIINKSFVIFNCGCVLISVFNVLIR